MQLPRFLTEMLPPDFVMAVGTELIWPPVAILGGMPLRCHLRDQLNRRLAWGTLSCQRSMDIPFLSLSDPLMWPPTPWDEGSLVGHPGT